MLSRQDFPGRSHAEWMLVLAPVVRVTLLRIWRFLEGGTHMCGPWDTPRLWSGSVYLTLCGLQVAGLVRSNILQEVQSSCFRSEVRKLFEWPGQDPGRHRPVSRPLVPTPSSAQSAPGLRESCGAL